MNRIVYLLSKFLIQRQFYYDTTLHFLEISINPQQDIARLTQYLSFFYNVRQHK